MLKRDWYVISDPDYWADVSEASRPALAADLFRTLTPLLGADAGFSPEQTMTAVEVMLRGAEHLSDAIPLGRLTVADAAQFARLLLGINLLAAYLTQIAARLAYQVNTGSGADLSGLTAAQRAELVGCLARLSAWLEGAAGLCQAAHVLVTVSDRRARR